MNTSPLLTLLVAAAMAVDLQAAQQQSPHPEKIAANDSATILRARNENASGTNTKKSQQQNARERYVSASSLNVRSSGSSGGKVLRKLKKGERVHVYESRNGWVRISSDNASSPEWVTRSSLRSRQPAREERP